MGNEIGIESSRWWSSEVYDHQALGSTEEEKEYGVTYFNSSFKSNELTPNSELDVEAISTESKIRTREYSIHRFSTK